MDRHYRKHLRIPGFDYATLGYYFVTLCTAGRYNYFAIHLDARYGQLALDAVAAGASPAQQHNTGVLVDKINLLPEKFNVLVDFYVIMPDHLHLIIGLNLSGKAGQGPAATTFSARQDVTATTFPASQGAAATTLPTVINALKGWVTRALARPVWQPNYFEHIVRSEESLHDIREYILANPFVTE